MRRPCSAFIAQAVTPLLALLLASLQPDATTPVVNFGIPRPMELETERDPITDRVSAYAVARTQNGRLWVGCDPDHFRGLRVYVRGRGWFEGDFFRGGRTVTYRFDNAAPERMNWRTRKGAALLRSPGRVANFLDWMRASQRLVIRARDVERREVDLIFPLAGSRAAVDGMLRACSGA